MLKKNVIIRLSDFGFTLIINLFILGIEISYIKSIFIRLPTPFLTLIQSKNIRHFYEKRVSTFFLSSVKVATCSSDPEREKEGGHVKFKFAFSTKGNFPAIKHEKETAHTKVDIICTCSHFNPFSALSLSFYFQVTLYSFSLSLFVL
jgi:hypothetical protein